MKGLNRVSTRAFKAPITRMAGRTSLQEPCHTWTWYMAFCVIQLVEYLTEKSENALTHAVEKSHGFVGGGGHGLPPDLLLSWGAQIVPFLFSIKLVRDF